MKERFPVGIMRSGRVIIAVSKKKADIGKGAMIDGEHQWAGVSRGGGEARVLEFEERGGVCSLVKEKSEEGLKRRGSQIYTICFRRVQQA